MIGFVIVAMTIGITMFHVACAASPDDVKAAKAVVDLMVKVNRYQREHPWRETDRDWIRATYYTGVMGLYRTTKDPAVVKQALAWANKHGWQAGRESHLVNANTCGQVWLELYFLDPQPERIKHARAYADKRIAQVAAGEAIHKGWDYVDTLYVGPPTYAMLGKATGEKKYYDYMHQTYWEVVDHLFNEEYGLFYRDKKYFEAKTDNGKKVFWSRGNGWAFGGIPRVLTYMADDDPYREKYLELYRTMAASLIACQPEDGLWRSNLADIDQCPNPETSGTAFFCYGLAWGINQGLLDQETYLAPTLKAWTGLVRHVNAEGRLGYVQQVGERPYPVCADQTHEYAAGLFLLAGGEIHKMLLSGKVPKARAMIRQYAEKNAKLPKQKTPGLGQRQVFARNGGWCWFQDPRAIIHDGKLVVGSVSGSGADRGDIRATTYDLMQGKDLGTFVLHPKLDRNDHAAPVFYARPDDRILAVYAYHNGPTHFFRISEPNDPTRWGPEQAFKHPRGVTYMNVYHHPPDEMLYNFYRDTWSNEGTFCPFYMTSKDHGTTWNTGGQLIAHGMQGQHRPYSRYWSDGEYVHVCFTESHPQEIGNEGCGIYYAKFKAGKFYRADGTLTKDLAKDGPLLPSEAETIFKGDSQNSAWTSAIRADAQGRVAIAYSVRKSPSDHRFRYAVWDGKAWNDKNLAYAGPGLYPAAYDYTGLVTIDPSNLSRVWFSTNVDPVHGTSLPSGKHEIYEAATTDGGRSWKVTALTKNSPSDNLRPIGVSGEGWTVLLWLRGRYTTYTDFAQDVVGIVLDAPETK